MSEEIKYHSIAFCMWMNTLDKVGFPRNESGTMMNIYQLYKYWDTKVNKQPFLIHASQFKT